MRQKIVIAGLSIVQQEPNEFIDFLILQAHSRKINGMDIHFINAGSIYFAKENHIVKKMYLNSDCLVPDGKSLEMVAKLSGKHLPQIRGPWVFRELFNRGRASGVKHFLLGTTTETLEKLEAQLKTDFPGVIIVGKHSPPFGTPTTEELAFQDQLIEDASPDVIWLGVSSPKQDFEAQRLARKFSVMTLAVGAAFDFVAGTQKEAPVFFQKIGVEWFYRLLSNPKRLWKRYLFGNFVFLYEAFKPGSSKPSEMKD